LKIRSITYFLDPGWPFDEPAFDRAGAFLAAARPVVEGLGYEVQSARLALPPFPRFLPPEKLAELPRLAQELEALALGRGFEYLSLGPALPERPESFVLIPPVLEVTGRVFFSGIMTLPQGGIDLEAVLACAVVIERLKDLSPDGFANLRFCAAANIPPGGPFLPMAYHRGGPPEFALAAQAADLAMAAFDGADSLEEARRRLIEAMEAHSGRLSAACQSLAAEHGVNFGGLDLTLAPFPSEEASIGGALERLGLPGVGRHGSLAASAFLMDTVDRVQYPRAGFNGLMLPVLEDSVLAQRAAEGSLTIKDLLMYSAVCGTGLDTVPLPGDTSAGELAAVLLDVAALSQRLGKPLTARLMPVPGKKAGDPTGFDFAFFANSRVMALDSGPLAGPLGGRERLKLEPRPA
jgi:uncharacterized protein (UPF0210 family)